jgi:hypothetical protein
MNIFNIMPDFLRDPDTFFKDIQAGKDIKTKAWMLALTSALSFMAYGLMVGLSKSPLQALSSGIKMPILFLVSMAFCLPALYFFSLALLATPLKMLQVLTVVLLGMGVTSFLLLGLAPITLFFVLTSSNYAFFQLLAVAFTGVSAWIGVYFIWRGMTFVDAVRDNSTQQLGRRILMLWIVLYAFVGTQMTWRLSPFIGNPEDPFYLIKPSRDNFYVDVIHAIQGALQLPASSDVNWIAPILTTGLCFLTLGALVYVGRMFLVSNSKQKIIPEKPEIG